VNGKDFKIKILFSLTSKAYSDYKNLNFKLLFDDMVTLLSKVDEKLAK
jgi:hypothetical protein